MASRASQRGRGGYQKPRDPAPVSGPGASSRRTDGGPGQPVRPIPATQENGGYGTRKASIEQQQAAPMRSGGAPSPVSTGPPVAAPVAPEPGSLTPLDAPSERPNESLLAGVDGSFGPAAELRAVYLQTGNEAIRELVEAMEEGR